MQLIPLDRTLLGLAIALERDATTKKTTRLLEMAPLDLGYALIDGGELVGAGGLGAYWHGRAEAWMLVSVQAAKRQLVAGVRLARAFLDDKQRDPAFARIECYIRADMPWRSSFARALGFCDAPALLRRWGPEGADHFLYERIGEAA